MSLINISKPPILNIRQVQKPHVLILILPPWRVRPITLRILPHHQLPQDQRQDDHGRHARQQRDLGRVVLRRVAGLEHLRPDQVAGAEGHQGQGVAHRALGVATRVGRVPTVDDGEHGGAGVEQVHAEELAEFVGVGQAWGSLERKEEKMMMMEKGLPNSNPAAKILGSVIRAMMYA